MSMADDANAPPDGGTESACLTCARRRCSASAIDCLADPACVALYGCVSSCGDLACVTACRAASTVPYERTYDVTACQSACGITCYHVPPSPEMCQPSLEACETSVPGFLCRNPSDSCIEPPPGAMDAARCCGDGYCCASGVQACSTEHPCCNREPCGADGLCPTPTRYSLREGSSEPPVRARCTIGSSYAEPMFCEGDEQRKRARIARRWRMSRGRFAFTDLPAATSRPARGEGVCATSDRLATSTLTDRARARAERGRALEARPRATDAPGFRQPPRRRA